MGNKIKRRDLPRCPRCDSRPRWEHHYCACIKCGMGVYGTKDATRQEMGKEWIEHVISYYSAFLVYIEKE